MKLVIYGNGSMARLLYSYARRSMEVVGFTVDEACLAAGVDSFCGLPLVSFHTCRDRFDPRSCKLITAVGFLEMNDLRARKSDEARQKGYTLASYVHESVVTHDDVVIEDNCIILDYVSIHPGSRIGQGTFIASNTNLGHDCLMEPYNWLNAGVSIAGRCQVGRGCFFGVNSCVGQGVRLGSQTFVGANTLIDKDTSDGEVRLSEPGQDFRMKSKAFLKFSNKMTS